MTIRTKCPNCGDVEMDPGHVSMRLASTGDGGDYEFTCPACRKHVSKPVTRAIATVLLSAGVQPSRLGEPDGSSRDPADGTPPRHAPPLTLDDLIAFHFALEDDLAIVDACVGDR
ncbi:MAG TPA: hypothetical protein VEC15_02045 [Actinomycetota bacterium]|nr:hypothetical protein [Actinomycetota bacterium]